MDLAAVLALLVIFVALPLNIGVAALLWGLHLKHPHIEVLRERGIVASSMAVIVAVFALVFLNNDLASPVLDFNTTKLVTRTAILAASTVPALFWLRLYLKEGR
jgi:hypothetical protein